MDSKNSPVMMPSWTPEGKSAVSHVLERGLNFSKTLIQTVG